MTRYSHKSMDDNKEREKESVLSFIEVFIGLKMYPYDKLNYLDPTQSST